MQIVGVDDLAVAIERLANLAQELSGTFTIADPSVRSMREVYVGIARALDLRIVVVPVPFWIPLVVARAGKLFRLGLPITEDNLRGLRVAQQFETAGDLRRLGLDLRPLEEVAREFR